MISIPKVLLFANAMVTLGLMTLLFFHGSILETGRAEFSPTTPSPGLPQERVGAWTKPVSLPLSSNTANDLVRRQSISTTPSTSNIEEPCSDIALTLLSSVTLAAESVAELRAAGANEGPIDKNDTATAASEQEAWVDSLVPWPASLPPRRALTQARSMAEQRCARNYPNGAADRSSTSGQARCQVYYMHVHKSGGSTLCSLAAANGLNVDLASNCQEMMKSDGSPSSELKRMPWWLQPAYAQAEVFRKSKHDFISNEDNPFTTPPLPGPIIFVITVRNPLDRILSHFRHHRKDNKLTEYSFATFAASWPPADYWASNWYVQLLGGGPGDNVVPSNTDDGDDPNGPGSSGDSSNLQSNTGMDGTNRMGTTNSTKSAATSSSSRCFGNGPACSESALAAAVARLEGYFSAVLITDSPQAFRVSGLLLQRTLGWQRSVDTDSARRGTRVESRASVELAAHPEAYAQLGRSNRLDLRFYDRARALFHAQALKLLQEAHPPNQQSNNNNARTTSAASRLDAAALRDLKGFLGLDGSDSGKSSTSTTSSANKQGRHGLIDKGSSVVAKSGKGHMDSLIGKPLPAKLSHHGGSSRGSGGDYSPPASIAAPLGQLGAVMHDRSGFGGHHDQCKGLGVMGTEACRANLLQHAPTCNQLSYKDGKCFLHDTHAPGFYTDASPGHWTQAAM